MKEKNTSHSEPIVTLAPVHPSLFTLLILYAFMLMAGTTQAQTKYTEPFMNEIIANAKKKNLSPIERFRALDALVNFAHNLYPPDTTIKLINELLTINRSIHAADPKPYLLMIEGQHYLKKNNPDSALLKFREMIEEFDKSRRIFPFNSYLFSIRNLFTQLGKQEEKLKYYTIKLNRYLKVGPNENTAACYHSIAGYYLLRGDYNQVLTCYFKSRDVYRTFSPVGYVNMLSVIGAAYKSWGNLNRATWFLRTADSLAIRDHDSLRCQYCWLNLAIISDDQGRYQEALSFVDSGLAYGIRSYKIENAAILYSTAADIWFKLRKPDEAFRNLQIVKKLADDNHLTIESSQGTIEIDYMFYRYYSQKNDPGRAEQSLLRAYQKSDSLRSWSLKMKYQKELFLFYRNSPTPSKALDYAAEFFQMYNALSLNKNENTVAQYETELLEKQRETEIEDLNIKRTQQQRNYLTGGVFMLLIIIGIVLRLRYIQKTKRKLEDKNLQIAAEKENAELMRRRAEQSEQFKQQFLSNMSHEIRTPMNAVMGMTNLLIDKNPREDQHVYLDGIKKSSGILLHIINDILDLAKIEAGKIELEVIDFSLREVVDQVIQTMYFKAEEKGLSLKRSIPDSVPDVLTGDPVRINQILMNLAGNAIKFTDQGSVELKVEQISPGNDSSVMLKFSVTDTGVGIPPEKLGSVFEEFSQASASDTRRFGGTGLGLTISNHLVSLMNGSILVESEPGLGSVFSFELAFLPGSADKLKLQQDAEMNLDGSILDGLSLLIADDNDYNLVVAADTLRSKCNVTIKTATNGQEAVDLLMENEFDVVLMDVQMPVMNGFEATQHIRHKIPSPKNRIPVVALTASVLRSDLDNCRDAGMNGIIPKPFTATQLIRGVAEALNIPLRYSVPEKSSARQPVPDKKERVTDLTYLEKFCEGDPLRMKKYIGMFLAAVPGFTEKLLTALESADHAEIATQIHGFKTKWVMMGMHDTKILADNIENQCREGNNLNEVSAKVMNLLRQLELAISELQGS